MLVMIYKKYYSFLRDGISASADSFNFSPAPCSASAAAPAERGAWHAIYVQCYLLYSDRSVCVCGALV